MKAQVHFLKLQKDLIDASKKAMEVQNSTSLLEDNASTSSQDTVALLPSNQNGYVKP